jgi:hypothetical protein
MLRVKREAHPLSPKPQLNKSKTGDCRLLLCIRLKKLHVYKMSVVVIVAVIAIVVVEVISMKAVAV